MNFLNHHNKLNKTWYNGTTGILPVDNVIKKVLDISYAHHIERLMIMGNIMLLMMINPKEVYKWFIEMISIDAYEWVMEPNIYGMSQHSVGTLMMNRPYYASSNYILRMSNYKKGEWCNIWNALYYNFINTHKKYLIKNYSTASSVYNLERKDKNERTILFKIADKILKTSRS
jgi:deoxyribodipyrimidine photolyase-related protein